MFNAIPLYKMRHSIEPRDRIYVKGYGFMSFARSMSNKYGKKLVDTAQKSATDAKKKLLLKGQYKQLQKQQVIWLVIKLLIKQQLFQRKNLMIIIIMIMMMMMSN